MMQFIATMDTQLYFLDEKQLIVATPFGSEEEFHPDAYKIPREVWEARWKIDKPRLIYLETRDNNDFYLDPARGVNGLIVRYYGGNLIPHVPTFSEIPYDVYLNSLAFRRFNQSRHMETPVYQPAQSKPESGVAEKLLDSVHGLDRLLKTL